MERVLLDDKTVERSIARIAHEILEKNQGATNLCLIGIRTRGIFLAKRIQEKIRNYIIQEYQLHGIQLAVLVDRGARELPIHPDYTGIFHTAANDEEISVKLKEIDGKDEVLLSTVS